MNENETPPLKDLMPEDKMGMMESAKGMGMRSVFPDADWQLYEQRKAQMAEEPVVQGSEVRPANNSANLLSQMAENPEATARAANSLGEAAGIAPFDDSLTEDQKMRLHRMERSIDVDPNTNKSYQPDQIEKQRRDFVDENARLVGGVAKGEPAETIPPEPEELDPSEPILGVVEGIVEPVEGERTTQDILNDLKRVGGKMFSDQREALVEKLRAEGVNLSDRVNEDTPEGRYERKLQVMLMVPLFLREELMELLWVGKVKKRLQHILKIWGWILVLMITKKLKKKLMWVKRQMYCLI